MIERNHSLINLSKGWPSPSLLPTDILLQASQHLLRDPHLATPSLLYGPDPGYQPLRESIAAWLSEIYYTSAGTRRPIDPDRICITGGASQNLACILQVFTDAGGGTTKKVYMVAPTYHLAGRIFEDNGFVGRLKAVPEDAEGIDIEYLEKCLLEDEKKERDGRQENGYGERNMVPTKRPLPTQKHYRNVIYAVPTFSNPSGKTMTMRRRERLVRLARQHDALIIIDDVYDMLRWISTSTAIAPATVPPAPPARLVDIDRILDGGPTLPFGNVVSNGSFSKILGPGVRTGWAEASLLLIQGLSQCGSSVSGGCPSHFTAAIVAETLRNGALQRHIDRVLIPALQKRFRTAIRAVEQYLMPHGVSLDVEGPASSADERVSSILQGGYFIYLLLPAHILAKPFAARAWQEEHVLVASGDLFQVCGDNHDSLRSAWRGLRVCVAWEDEDRLTEGIQRLGQVLAHMVAEPEPARCPDLAIPRE